MNAVVRCFAPLALQRSIHLITTLHCHCSWSSQPSTIPILRCTLITHDTTFGVRGLVIISYKRAFFYSPPSQYKLHTAPTNPSMIYTLHYTTHSLCTVWQIIFCAMYSCTHQCPLNTSQNLFLQSIISLPRHI